MVFHGRLSQPMSWLSAMIPKASSDSGPTWLYPQKSLQLVSYPDFAVRTRPSSIQRNCKWPEDKSGKVQLVSKRCLSTGPQPMVSRTPLLLYSTIRPAGFEINVTRTNPSMCSVRALLGARSLS